MSRSDEPKRIPTAVLVTLGIGYALIALTAAALVVSHLVSYSHRPL